MADAADGDFIDSSGSGPLPTEGDFVPTPSFGERVHNAAPGKVYDAITGADSDAFGEGPVIPKEVEDWAKKNGWFNDYQNGKVNLLRSFNEAITRPLIYGGYLATRGLSADAEALAAGAHEAITEAGGSESAARAPGELLGYYLSRGDIKLDARAFPRSERVTTEQAARVGTLTPGGEKAYFHTAETPIAHQDIAESLAARNASLEGYITPDTSRAIDLHAAARQIAPETFERYDTLSTQRDMFRSQISDMGRERDASPEAQAARDSIETILGKVNGVEDRLTGAAQRRLDDARETLDDILHKDTPEMAEARQRAQAVDYQMRDLAPDVSAAYRQADERLPEAQEEPADVTAQPQAAEQTPQATPAAQPEAQPQANLAPIIGDVQQKLVAAGRPADEASAAAQLVAAHYEARANRFDGVLGTAQDLYSRDAPNIRGAGQRTRDLVMAQRTLEQGEFSTEPGAADAQGNALPQTIIPGAEGSAAQLAKARETAGKGLKTTKAAQKEAGPLFAAGEGGKQGTLFQGKRGSLALGEARNTIKLLKNADASTFIHETGHQWLEEMMSDAGHEQAPADLLSDAKSVRDWYNRSSDGRKKPWAEGGTVPTKAHEMFARGFERYMMEGVSPSRSLDTVFAKFKNWLTQIYQTVKGLNSPITDNIRGVFDRLLSSEPQRSVVAAEREPERTIADRHEHEAETTPPKHAAAVADNMRAEIDRQAKAVAPEIYDDLTGRTGRSAEADAGNSDRGHAAEPVAQEGKGAGQSGTQPAGGNTTEEKGASARASAYTRIPREPTRLADFIRRLGGVRDDRGDIAAIIGTGRSGLLKKSGLAIDELTHRAWEVGYFPESDTRPTANDLLEKLSEDLTGNAQYSDADHDAIAAYRAALQSNAEVDRLANELGINAKQMTKGEFWSRVSEHMSIEDMHAVNAEMSAAAESEFAEAERAAQEWMESHDVWEPNAFYDGQNGRTIDDLERERDAEDASRDARQGVSGPEPSRLATSDEDDVQGGGGQGGTGAGNAGRHDDQGAAGRFAGPDGDAAARSYIERYLKNLNVPKDAEQIIRDVASRSMDFNDARFGKAAYTLYHQIKAANALVEVTAQKAADAFRTWDASGSDEGAEAYVEATQRALVANNARAQLRAGWGYAGHALQRVDRVSNSENYIAFIKRSTGKTPEELRQEGRLLYQLDTADKKVNFLDQSRAAALQRLKTGTLSCFINNLISGPITHAGYSVGNTVWAFTKAVPTTAVAATIDAVRGAGPERVYYGEIPAQIYGALRGARDALPAAWKAAKTGVPFMRGADELENVQGNLGVYKPLTREQTIFANSGPLLKKTGYVLETPSRVVTAIHTIFYGMGYEQEIARMAYRDAMQKGLAGNDFSTHIARYTERPPVEDIEAAHAEALKMVLMERPAYDSFTGGLTRLTNQSFIAKLIMPFMQIGTNILKQGLVEHSPLGLASQAVRDNLSGKNGEVARSTQYAKIMVGTGAATAVLGLTAEGIMTGGGPSDRAKRAALERTGWRPYSIRAGDTYIPYRKYLGPLGPLVAGASDMYEIGHTAHEEGFTKAAAATVFGLSEVVADETWMSGLSNLIDAARNWDQHGQRYLRNMSMDFVPFSIGMKQMATQIDPYVRMQNNEIEALKSRIPFVSQDVMPRRDVWGEPMEAHTAMGPSDARADHVDDELMRLNKYFPANAKKSIMGVPLTEQQYDDYVRISGRYSKMQLEHDMNSAYWASADDETKVAMVKADIEAGRQQGRDAVMVSDPTIWQRAAALKMHQQGTYNSP